jgi:hypothetical protein
MAKPAYVWNGTAWEAIGPVIPASPFFYQATAPTSPATGNVWVDSDAVITTPNGNDYLLKADVVSTVLTHSLFLMGA